MASREKVGYVKFAKISILVEPFDQAGKKEALRGEPVLDDVGIAEGSAGGGP